MPTYRVRHTYSIAGWTESEVTAANLEDARQIAVERGPIASLPPGLTRHLDEAWEEIDTIEEGSPS